MNDHSAPVLKWDIGTAYELFISLQVLHNPDEFGLRPSWAAGVRSRLSPEQRKIIEEAQEVIKIPFHWIYSLPQPKDTASVLWALRQIPPEGRLPVLGIGPGKADEAAELLRNVAARRSWDQKDFNFLREYHRSHNHESPRPKTLTTVLDKWSHAAEFGEQFREALQSYYQSFFADEEERIATALRMGLERAQELAKRASLAELLETLSQWLQMQEYLEENEILLIPSFWCSPLAYIDKISAECRVITFGVRPSDASLDPGEAVPDTLLLTLKALADPTRLRILCYLVQEPLTPAQLARRLRLRPPTLTHHLRALRLAGLVHVGIGSKEERFYTARLEAIFSLQAYLKEFLACDRHGENGE